MALAGAAGCTTPGKNVTAASIADQSGDRSSNAQDVAPEVEAPSIPPETDDFVRDPSFPKPNYAVTAPKAVAAADSIPASSPVKVVAACGGNSAYLGDGDIIGFPTGVGPVSDFGKPYDGKSADLSVSIISREVPREKIKSVSVRAVGSVVGAQLASATGFSHDEGSHDRAIAAETIAQGGPQTVMDVVFKLGPENEGDFRLAVTVNYEDAAGLPEKVEGALEGTLDFSDSGFFAEIRTAAETNSYQYQKGVPVCGL